MSECIRVCVCVRACACVRACVCVCVRACVCVCVLDAQGGRVSMGDLVRGMSQAAPWPPHPTPRLKTISKKLRKG